jgi:hypothetical protein
MKKEDHLVARQWLKVSEMQHKGVVWMHLTQDKPKWWRHENDMNFRVHKRRRVF